MTPQEALQQLYNVVAQVKLTLEEHNTMKQLALTVLQALNDKEIEKHEDLDMQAPCEFPTPEAEVLATEKKELNGWE